MTKYDLNPKLELRGGIARVEDVPAVPNVPLCPLDSTTPPPPPLFPSTVSDHHHHHHHLHQERNQRTISDSKDHMHKTLVKRYGKLLSPF